MQRKAGDLVLVYHDEKPVVYARVEAIEFDVKKDWYQLTLLLLSIPAQTVTWILKESYIDGESFTMAGVPMKIEEVKVDISTINKIEKEQKIQKIRQGKKGTIIPFKKS